MNKLSGKRVLITGGAGFIGSELVRQVAIQGAEVTIVDNLVNGKRENVQDILNEKVNLVVVDIREDGEMKRLIACADIILHLACLGVRHSIHSPKENNEVNASATLSLLILAKEGKVDRFVYVSTSEVYGTAKRVPMTEEHPSFPHTVYGSSKLAGECYTRAFWETYKFPTVVVRPFNSYGPRSHHEGDTGEVIPKFLLRAMAGKPMIIFGHGTQTRDFAYVSDTARGILLSGMVDNAIGETINIGHGSEVSINELARIIREVVDKPSTPIEHAEPRPGDVMRLFADNTKAHELLGFKSEIDLHQGLERLKSWYLSRGVPIETLLEEEQVPNW